MSDDLERLRSIRQGGKTKGMVRVETLKEDGKVRGFQIEHADGRKEAVVRPDAVKYKLSIKD